MQVIAEALARFRLEVEPVEKFQLVQVALESGRGEHIVNRHISLAKQRWTTLAIKDDDDDIFNHHWQSKMMMMISLIIIGNQR